ncbi:MAG: helix-turn-helix domain-containing protein [Lactobacillus sp.]|nr:helix-turn-helix domain-containing protein [Lactobacillus sp.]
MLKIGALIRTERERVGLSQSELAAQLQVTRQTVSKWELDKSYPDVAMLVTLAQTLHCDVRVLLGMKQKQPLRHWFQWRKEDKEVKWYAGGQERRRVAVALLAEMLPLLPPEQAALKQVLQKQYALLMADGTSVPYILMAMNVEVAGVMHKEHLMLSPQAEALYQRLMRLSNIRYR